MINYLIQDTKRPGVPPDTYIVCSFDREDDEHAIMAEILEMFPHAKLPRESSGALAFNRFTTTRLDYLVQINIRGLATDEHMLFKLKWGLKNVFI